MKSRQIVATALVMAAAVSTAGAQSDVPGVNPSPGIPASQMPSVLKNVRYEQRLNERLPLDLTFKDEDGRTVRLGDYFGRRSCTTTARCSARRC
jgi:protein SCO1